jgi:hypothetical protein
MKAYGRVASRLNRFNPQGKSPRYPLDRRLGEPQSRFGRYREVKILDPTGTRTQNPLSSSLLPVAIPTALPWQCNILAYLVLKKSMPLPCPYRCCRIASFLCVWTWGEGEVYREVVFNLGYGYLRGYVKTSKGYAKTSYGTAWSWTSSGPRTHEDSSPNWGAGMPETSSIISLTGQNHINNLLNI